MFLRFSALLILIFSQNTYAFSSAQQGIDYLNNLAQNRPDRYTAPNEIHDSYQMAIYVNVAGKTSFEGLEATTSTRQKMWVLTKNTVGQWEIGLWDENFWAQQDWDQSKGTPPYSWPISSGRKHNDGSISSPTFAGTYNLDDRLKTSNGRTRHKKGYYSPGMYDAMFVDYHYSSGRATGVALHGTTPSMYKRLGSRDSHGCVRIHQDNSVRLYEYVHQYDHLPKVENPLWGTMPRFYVRGDQGARFDYVRDGQLLYENGQLLTKEGYKVLLVFFNH